MKISVILPVYNVEKYLGKALDSVINQTLKEIEIFVVNDGSKDRSGEIADEYALIDERIIVIHKENGGAPSARNTAIDKAQGEYMYFMDPDDWAEPTMLERMYNCAKEENAELVISGFTMEYYEDQKELSYQVKMPTVNYLDQNDFRSNAHKYFGNTMMAVPWNKLYKSSYILNNDLRFPNIKWDDLHFNMEVIKDINKVCIIDDTSYHFFRSRPGSETTTVFDSQLYKKRKEQFLHVLEVYKHWNRVESDAMKTIYAYYSERLVQCIQEIVDNPNIDKKNKYQDIKEILKDQLTIESLKYGVSESFTMKIVQIPMKYKMVKSSYLLGKMISILKNNFSELFYNLRAKVVHKA